MKNSTLLLCLSLTFIFGCSKKDSDQITPSTNIDNVQGQSRTVYQLNFNNGKSTVAKQDISINTSSSRMAAAASINTSNHVSGSFTTVDGIINRSNVFASNGVARGSISISGAFLTCQLDAVCLQVVGNEAVYRGIITSVQNNGGYPDLVIPGNYISLRVKDNGEGNNAPADQFAGTIYLDRPIDGIDANYDWFKLDWFGYTDIAQGGRIQVK